MISGADESFLYDNLKIINREKQYVKYQGQAIGKRMYLIAFCSIFVGFLAKLDLRIPIILSCMPIVITLFITLKFIEPPISEKGEKILQEKKIINYSVVFVANNKNIKWLIVFSALIAVISKLWFFTYNPYFEYVNLPLEQFGIIFFCLNIIAASTSYFASNIAKNMSQTGSIILILFCISVPIIIMGIWPITIFSWLVIIQNIARGYHKPLIEQLIHDEIKKNRATIASIQSSANLFFVSISMIVFSKLILSNFTLPLSLIILGFTSLLIGILLVIVYTKIFHKKG